IIEFENFSSVNAKTRRSTPAVINSSIWAFTVSTPASANTTGVVSDGVALRPASTSTATVFIGANVAATRPTRIRGEEVERPGRNVPVLDRGHHALDRLDLAWRESMR